MSISSFGQSSDEAFVREPGHRAYQVKQGAEFMALAETAWETAILSENTYFGDWINDEHGWRSPLKSETKPPRPISTPYQEACKPGKRSRLPLRGWRFWSNFPSRALVREAEKTGLYVEVWEKLSFKGRTLAVVFKGTQYRSRRDWISNLRWFWYWLQHFVPFYQDQYTVVAKLFGAEFIEEFTRRGYDHSDHISIVTSGHSLGGGLAQQFAYSLPLDPNVPSVAHVFAFNPSPVTGWYSVKRAVRTHNAQGLTIDRLFEHGEILAYLRLLLSYIYPPSASDPSVREIRVNFVRSWNFLTNHGMRPLACGFLRIVKKITA
jgi:hypothetical protein